jgi:hypothetical protein
LFYFLSRLIFSLTNLSNIDFSSCLLKSRCWSPVPFLFLIALPFSSLNVSLVLASFSPFSSLNSYAQGFSRKKGFIEFAKPSLFLSLVRSLYNAILIPSSSGVNSKSGCGSKSSPFFGLPTGFLETSA